MSGLWPCYQRVHEGKDRDTDFAGHGNPPPGFRGKMNQLVKEQYNQDIEQIVERDSVESAVIIDAIENNHAI